MNEDRVGKVDPSVDEVARLVGELVASAWPATPAETRAWCAEHGIPTEDAELVRAEDGSESWSSPLGAPWPAAGWHVSGGEFVGVSWFLWLGLAEDVVPALADQLQARLVEIAGEPVEVSRAGGEDDRFSALWRTDDLTIEVYLHGGPVLGGELHESPVVQLHVDHTERSRRADAEARP